MPSLLCGWTLAVVISNPHMRVTSCYRTVPDTSHLSSIVGVCVCVCSSSKSPVGITACSVGWLSTIVWIMVSISFLSNVAPVLSYCCLRLHFKSNAKYIQVQQNRVVLRRTRKRASFMPLFYLLHWKVCLNVDAGHRGCWNAAPLCFYRSPERTNVRHLRTGIPLMHLHSHH